MRITLDTSILVRGHRNASGPCRTVLTSIADSSHVLVLSRCLLQEVEEVMRSPRVRQFSGLTQEQISEYIETLADLSGLADVVPLPFPTPAANFWIAMRTAFRGNVDVLCTLDGHCRQEKLAHLVAGAGISVMSDVQLLRVLRGEVRIQ